MSSLPFESSVKFELMQKFLADIPGVGGAKPPPPLPSANHPFENAPKNLSNPLKIHTDTPPSTAAAVSPPHNFVKTENLPGGGMADNPLFSAALAQMARDTESNKSRNLDPSSPHSPNLPPPALMQQAQAS